MREFKAIIQLLMKEKKDVYLSILFGFIAGVTAVGLFAANGYLISRAAIETPLYVLIIMVAVVKIGSFLRAGSRYGERYFSHRATFTMLSDLRVYFYDKLEKLSASKFQSYRSGDILARIVGDVESLQNFFLRVLYPPILMMLIFLSTILFVTFYSLSVAFILLVGLIVTGLLIPAWFARKQRRISSQIRSNRAHFSTEVTEWFHGFRELKIHQRLDEKEQKLIESSEIYMTGQEQESLQASYNQSINTAISFIISWLVLALGAYLVTVGRLDGVFLAMLVMISLTVFEHSNPMAAFPVYYEDSEKAAKRLYQVTEETEPGPKNKGKTGCVYWQSAPSIDVKDVSFSFENELRQTVKDLQLTLPARSKTAIVGASGSGKSTLLNLLLKLHSADTGEIYINGEKLENMEQEEIWKRTTVVLQENHFFAGTVKENLLTDGEFWSEEQLDEVLAAVQLQHFSLTDEVVEKGQNLSGGEKQRLAMARAILEGGSLWLLDEPTSSLDSWTQKRLYDTLFAHTKEATVVIVSHRLTGFENMDQIVVMDEGQIVEVGTFDELMEKKGYFYQLKQVERDVVVS